MTKKILFFTKPHGVYVAGDVAGFDEVTAKKFAAVAVPYNPEIHDLKKKPADPASAPDVVAALADIAAREAAVTLREAAVGDPAELVDPAVKDGKAAIGEPPKMTGGKA